MKRLALLLCLLLTATAHGQVELPTLRTVSADTPLPVRLDAKHGIKATPWASEVGQPAVADGVKVVDADCTVVANDVRGTAIRITIDKSPAFNLLHSCCVQARSTCSYTGIETATSDINLLEPRVCSFRDVGIWARGGNTQTIGGHSYGGDVAVRSGGDPKLSGHNTFTGTQANDARIGFELLVASQLTGCSAKQCWGRSILVGAPCEIAHTNVGAYAANNGSSVGYVGIEFASRDKYLGNWSSYSGYVTVGDGATGIVCNADFCTIEANIVGRGPNAKALKIEKPIGNCKARLKVSGCGKGVAIEQLGHNNRIEIDGMNPVVKLPPPGWGARNNVIEINGVAIGDK